MISDLRFVIGAGLLAALVAVAVLNARHPQAGAKAATIRRLTPRRRRYH